MDWHNSRAAHELYLHFGLWVFLYGSLVTFRQLSVSNRQTGLLMVNCGEGVNQLICHNKLSNAKEETVKYVDDISSSYSFLSAFAFLHVIQ